MFKSVFAKYVTAFMVIISLGFALLLLIITAIVGNFSMQHKTNMMENAAKLIGEEIRLHLTDDTSNSLSAIVQPSDQEHYLSLLEAFSGEDHDLFLLISHANGQVLATVVDPNTQSTVITVSTLPDELVQQIHTDRQHSGNFSVQDMQDPIWVCASAIEKQDGELCGIVAVCSVNPGEGIAVQEMTKTVITSALLVLLAALIAAYIITERTVTPLREMQIAARNFALGRFDTRVIVRGKDEVAELAESFNQMADALQNLEKMRNSFVANVSHDLRTPMTTIAGFIDGIRDGVIPPEEHAHYLNVVSAEVHRLSRLVASLLDISRIQAGDRKFTMKAFDICEMARLILISFEKNIEEKHLEVEFDCEEDRIMVLADRDAIYQIFYNICHNALKFSREGGLLRIQISGAKEKKVHVSVYNEGDGIPIEDQPLIFERFYKSDKSRGLDKSGVGLGLYIAKTIITAHGEKIGVNSEPGKNCEFYFTLLRATHTGAHSTDG